MYPAPHALTHPDRAAFVMAGSGETVTYAELEARSNRLAHLLRAHGLRRLDHLAIYLGLSWLAIGLVYLGFLTRGFSQQPPEMDFQEAA